MTWPTKRQLLAVLCIAAILLAVFALDDFAGAAEVSSPLLLFLFLVGVLVCRTAEPILPSIDIPFALDSRPPPTT